MIYHVADTLNKAYERTKKALIEPFDLWKWLKLAIIVFLISGGLGFGNSGYNTSYPAGDIDSMGEIDSIGQVFDQLVPISYPGLIIMGIVLLIVITEVFGYISCVMEFVFVDSLTKHEVKFWDYSRKYLGPGLDLFIIRFILFLIFFSLIIIAALPLILQLIDQTSGPFLPGLIAGIGLLGFILLGITITGAVIDSFINLSIPLAMYHEIGIIAAFKKVFNNSMEDKEQILAYWIGRIFLWIGAGIVVGIVVILCMLILGIFMILIDVILYLILSSVLFGSQTLLWVVLAPVIFVQLIMLTLIVMMTGMPLNVFMKYHMLTFLERWYPDAEIPFFDVGGQDTVESAGVQENPGVR